MIEVERKGNCLYATASGKVTAEDYKRVLIPAIEAVIAGGRKIRMLYELGDNFVGYTAAAMWDDAMVGMSHIADFEKVAVVTDEIWIRGAIRAFGFAMPCPVRLYDNDQVGEARSWLSQ